MGEPVSLDSCAATPGKKPTARSISPRSSMGRGSRVVSGIMRTLTPGASRSIERIREGSQKAAVASAMAMRNVAWVFDTSKVSGVTAASRLARAERTEGHSASARGVGLTPYAVRISNSSPRLSRRRLMAFDTAGCVIARWPAARVRFCSVMTASKTRSKFRSSVRKLMESPR